MRINSNPSSPYLIECSDGSKLHFAAYGYIYKIEDANGNVATVNYSGSTITALNDGVGRVTTLASESSGSVRRLTSVTDPTGRTVTLRYSGGNLQSVSYMDIAVYNLRDGSGGIFSVSFPEAKAEKGKKRI